MLPNTSTLDPKIASLHETLTRADEAVYNKFLYISAKALDRPFNARKNFDSLPVDKILHIKKISSLLHRHPEIKQEDFFSAPFVVYAGEDVSFYDLKFFASYKAIACYTRYMRKKSVESPDAPDIIMECKEGLKFLFTFCQSNNITIDEYKHRCEGVIPTFLLHLKEHKINFYLVHALDVDSIVRKQDRELLEFCITDFYDLYTKSRMNYLTSSRFKTTIKPTINKLNNKLTNG